MNNRTALILISLLAMGQLPLVAQGLLLRTEWWRPNGVVLAVAIDSVNQVAYLGGDFSQLNNPDPPFSSVARQRLAAIDMSTGDVLPWNPGADGQVIALAVRGNNVFVGGQQVQCGGQTRPLLTVLDRTTGNATSWAPQVSGGYVKAFAFSTGKLYFTGGFTAVDGSGRAGAACFDLSTSTLTNWAPQPNDLIRTMVVHNGSVYLGGAFTTMNGEARDRTAQVDDEFGGLLSWSPSVTGGTGVFTMARQGSTLYLGGDLTAVNGQPRNFAAAVGTTGALASWNPAISQMVHSIVPFNGNIAMGGDFNDFTNMVVVNPTTASALTYSDINGQVFALASTTTHLIAGGSFNAVSNYPVTKLAAFTPIPPSVALTVRMFLEGPYVSTTQLMNDNLRAGGLLPYTEPYTALGYTYTTGGATGTASPTLLNVTGNNAIVDWVVVELRNSANNTQVVASRRALLQRDGDVVDLNGMAPLVIPAPPASYHVAVRHRNHLGVMSAAPIVLSATTTSVDFRNASQATFGTDARRTEGSRMVLWSGDVAFDGNAKYSGSSNDRDPILSAIGGVVPTNTLTGQYRQEDLNLDGVVKYSGSGNDRDIILQTIGGTVPTAVRDEQLP